MQNKTTLRLAIAALLIAIDVVTSPAFSDRRNGTHVERAKRNHWLFGRPLLRIRDHFDDRNNSDAHSGNSPARLNWRSIWWRSFRPLLPVD